MNLSAPKISIDNRRTVAFASQASNVFFHILTQCNLTCRHCYINPEQHGQNMLSADVIDAWLSVFAKKCHEPNVIFLGGEPTLHPHLHRAVRKAQQLGYRSVTVDTNGYLFHDFLTKVSPDVLNYLSFSLDGATALTNDAIRGTGSYEQCVKGILAAVAKGFNTSLIYTVSRMNLHEIELMPALLKKLGISRFFIQVIGLRGNSASASHHCQKHSDPCERLSIDKNEWIERIPAVAKQVAELGIATVYPKVYLDYEEPFYCAGKVARNYFIFPNGRVYQCPLCEDFPLHSYMMNTGTDHHPVLTETERINESDLFNLDIPEGCVMNKLIQPENISYMEDGSPEYKIGCCLLKEEL